MDSIQEINILVADDIHPFGCEVVGASSRCPCLPFPFPALNRSQTLASSCHRDPTDSVWFLTSVSHCFVSHTQCVAIHHVYSGCTPVDTLSEGDISLVTELIENGPDQQQPHSDGTTALMEATGNGHEQLVQVLLANRVDPIQSR